MALLAQTPALMTTPLRNIALRFILPALVIGLLIPVLGCSNGAAKTIVVFAAASLTDSFQEIASNFESENPGVEVKLNFAGSQRLRSQLELGADADIFASADQEQMALAKEAGLVGNNAPTFATSSMAAIASRNSGVETLADLANPGVKLVLAHESVPAGRYSRQLLQRLSTVDSGLGEGFAERVLSNLVSEETSVKFVEQKVVLGQADVGIIYRPGVLTATANDAARELSLPSVAEETRAHYPIAVLEISSERELARLFVDFVLSEPSQTILARYGFDPP